MIKRILHIIKNIFGKQINQDGDFIFTDEIIVPFFNNVRKYVVEETTISIYTRDIIPKLSTKSTIDYIKTDLYSVFNIKHSNNKKISLRKLERFDRYSLAKVSLSIISKYRKVLKEQIDKKILYTISEMGRLTSSSYGQAKDSLSLLTVSKNTSIHSLIHKIEYADEVLNKINGIGLKHIIISKCFYDKLRYRIYNNSIMIRDKQVEIQTLPDYLEKVDPVCLICSSVIDEKSTPGIVFVHKKPKVRINKNTTDTKTDIEYFQEYEIQKSGSKPELFYLRFYQT